MNGSGISQPETFKTPEASGSIRLDVVRRTAEAIGSAVKSNRKEFRLHLVPDNLGAITIRMVSQNGRLSLRITADNTGTGQLIAGSVQDLGNTLQNQGVPIERTEVFFTGGGSAGSGNFSGGGDTSGQPQPQPSARWHFESGQNVPEKTAKYTESGLSVLA